MNIWNIPAWLEQEVKTRDKSCVYCGIQFIQTNRSRKSMPTWEHIINDANIMNRNNIALCCCSCNASKGAKELSIWIHSSYCTKKNINAETVSEVVKRALKNPSRCLEE